MMADSPYRLVIRSTGGPEVIEREALGTLTPGPGEVLVRHEAIGLNYIDTYHRSGLYPLSLPSGLGSEAAGVVEEAGDGAGFGTGERVAYGLAPMRPTGLSPRIVWCAFPTTWMPRPRPQ
jgi:NADPH2:quinone reductase